MDSPPFPRLGEWRAMRVGLAGKRVTRQKDTEEVVLRAIENGTAYGTEVVKKRPRT